MYSFKKGYIKKMVLVLLAWILIYIFFTSFVVKHKVSIGARLLQHFYGNISLGNWADDASFNDVWQYSTNISDAYRNQWIGFHELAGVDCTRVLNGSAKNSLFPQVIPRIFPHQFKLASQDCVNFRTHYGFQRYPRVSDEEKDFPLAFIILFYKDLDQILFLLRAIYRPHNVYCLSVDTKSSIEFLDAVRSVVRCLPNVFVASKLESIVYAGFTRLMADINCMEDLIQHPVQWKYVMNLPGQQFPLRSHLEMVKILQLYNGSSDVEGITTQTISWRFKRKYDYVTNNETGERDIVNTYETNSPPPHNIQIVKGSAYGTFSRDFVRFVVNVNNKVVRDFLAWCKSIYSPDEYFWATLQHSKTIHVPGRYTGDPSKKTYLSSFASWQNYAPCATLTTRKVCIFSPEDLPYLLTRKEIFANKFYITHHPAALHCLDQFIYNLTFAGTVRDLEYYQNISLVLKTKT